MRPPLQSDKTATEPTRLPRQKVLRPYVLLFALLTVVYHSNVRPIASGDSLPAALIPFSILLDRSPTLDRFGPYLSQHVWFAPAVVQKVGGHWYSRYPIAGPILTTPLYLPIAFIPRLGRQSPATLIAIARIAEKVVAAALAAAAALLLLLLLRRITSHRAAWLLTLVFALGTANWSTSSQALWQHTYGQLAILACLYAIERLRGSGVETRWYWIAGIAAGCALAIRPTNVLILPALAVVLWIRRANLADYCRAFLTPALAAAATAAYNFLVFHRLAGGYTVKWNGRIVDGLPGILFSPGRGLLIYTPIAIFALAALASRSREVRQQHRLVVMAASLFIVLYLAFFAAFPIWWGGYCWGPRLLTEILVPLMILVAVGLPALTSRRLRGAFVVLAIYGSLIQAIGVYDYPKGQWDALPASVDNHPDRAWNWVDNPVIRTARGGLAWEPYAIVAAALRGGPRAAAEKMRQFGINPY